MSQNELADWMESHNIPELLRQTLERIRNNRNYTAFKGLETTGAATVQVKLQKLTPSVSRIEMSSVSLPDLKTTEEELEDAKAKLDEAEKTVKEQAKEIENLKKAQTPKTTEKPRKIMPHRERKA